MTPKHSASAAGGQDPVVVLLSCHVPHTDTHTQFYANVLVKGENRVLVVAPGPDTVSGFDPRVRVKRLSPLRTGFYYHAALLNPVFAARERIRNIAQAYRFLRTLDACAVYVCTGVDALVVALLMKRRHRSKVVADLREIYEDRTLLLPSVLRPFAMGVFRRALRFLCRNSDEVIHVSQARQSLYAYLSKPGVVVRFMPDLAEFPPGMRCPRQNGRFSVVHAGSLRSPYGSNQLLRAIDILRRDGVRVRLTVIGGVQGTLECQGLLDRLIQCGSVEVLPTVPFDRVRDILAESDMGIALVLPIDTGHRYPAPRKLYEYFAAGLPVVAADAATIKPVIEEWQCGLAVDASSPDSIANGISMIAGDPRLRESMSRNARRAAEEVFNRDEDARVLCETVAGLTHGDRRLPTSAASGVLHANGQEE